MRPKPRRRVRAHLSHGERGALFLTWIQEPREEVATVDRHGAVFALERDERGALVHRRAGSASCDLPGTLLLGACAAVRAAGRRRGGGGFRRRPLRYDSISMHAAVASLPARDHPARRERERSLRRRRRGSALWSSASRVPTLCAVPHGCVHAWESHSKSNRPLSALVAREHRRRSSVAASPATSGRFSASVRSGLASQERDLAARFRGSTSTRQAP